MFLTDSKINVSLLSLVRPPIWPPNPVAQAFRPEDFRSATTHSYPAARFLTHKKGLATDFGSLSDLHRIQITRNRRLPLEFLCNRLLQGLRRRRFAVRQIHLLWSGL